MPVHANSSPYITPLTHQIYHYVAPHTNTDTLLAYQERRTSLASDA